MLNGLLRDEGGTSLIKHPTDRTLLGPLSGREAWVAYLAAWLAFAAGHAAIDFFSDAPSLIAALSRTGRVVVPAALLGLAAIAVANQVALKRRTLLAAVVTHLIASFVYATSWIAVTWALNLARSSIGSHNFVFFTPPLAAVHWHMVAGLLIYAAMAAIVHAARAHNIRLEERERMATEIALSNFNPHFLFNTLHSVRTLMLADVAKADDAHVKLARILRRAVSVRQAEIDFIGMEDEINFCTDYLDLEQMRFGDRLSVEISIDDRARNALTPPFLLQPLVENAVKHGVAASSNCVVVKLSARAVAAVVRVSVENSFDRENFAPGAWGYGLTFVRRRLRAAFGDKGQFEVQAKDDVFTATLEFPLWVETDE